MARPKRDMIPTESIAVVVYTLTRRGVLATDAAADMGDYTRHGVDAMLNRAARTIPITKADRGVWMVTDETMEIAERVKPALARAKAELHATPPEASYVRPLTRKDLAALVHALETLLKDGKEQTA